jgi:hypothetical protein
MTEYRLIQQAARGTGGVNNDTNLSIIVTQSMALSRTYSISSTDRVSGIKFMPFVSPIPYGHVEGLSGLRYFRFVFMDRKSVAMRFGLPRPHRVSRLLR